MKKFSEIPSDIFTQLDTVYEAYFDTAHNQDQIPVNEESTEKLNRLTPYWIHYALDPHDDKKVVSSIVIVPTQKEVALKFLDKEINEKQLLEMSEPSEHYSALYFCSAITLPEYRKQGIAKKLMQEVIPKIPLTEDAIFLVWPTTKLGNQFIDGVKTLAGVPILIRKE